MAAAYNQALSRCGFNAATRTFINQEGRNSVENLTLMTAADMDLFIKDAKRDQGANLSFPFLAVKRLKAFRVWGTHRIRQDLAAQPAQFTDAACVATMERMQEESEIKAAMKDATPDKPPALKTLKGWPKFWEQCKTYFIQCRGAAEIPLSYVFRESEVVTQEIRDAIYTSVDEEFIATTALSGKHFAIDNKRVWNEFKELNVGGPGWSFIKRFEKTTDGRGAVLALKIQCEGDASILNRKTKAYTSIANAVYGGARKHFTFADYVEIHQNAHNELEDCDEAMPASKKVTDFLKGITDPSLAIGIGIIISRPEMLSDFGETQKFLGTYTSSTATHASAGGGKRNLSETGTGGRGSGGRGRGRGRRGRGGGRGGRGRGKGGNDSKFRKYNDEEWKALKWEGQQAVFAERNAIKAADQARQTAQMGVAPELPPLPEGIPAPVPGAPPAPPTEDAGNQFGRNAQRRGGAGRGGAGVTFVP